MFTKPRLGTRARCSPYPSVVFALAFDLFSPWPFTSNAALAMPPSITAQPVDQAVCVGSGTGTVWFFCNATGTAPLSFQWRRGTTNLTNGDNIFQATTQQMHIYPVRLSDSAVDYNCLVTNAEGLAVTNNAALTVWPTGTADLNGDGTVNGLDIKWFVAAWLVRPPSNAMTASYCGADMDGNGFVECDDLCFFAQAVLQSPMGCGSPPENDDCPNATLISTGILISASTVYATRDGPHISCEQSCSAACNTAPDVWFKWIADFTGPADFTMCDASRYDTMLAIYDGCPSMGGVELACNDDVCWQYISRYCGFQVTAGRTYWISISGWGGNKGCFSLRVNPGGCN